MIKNNLGVENEKFTMISRFAVVSGLVVCSALGLATVARAGEGGVAGSAAFTIDTSGSVSATTFIQLWQWGTKSFRKTVVESRPREYSWLKIINGLITARSWV